MKTYKTLKIKLEKKKGGKGEYRCAYVPKQLQ